jgi:putative ATP-binding cassette transporter
MQTEFNFDKQLWQRFIKIAQPYWYPMEKGATGFFGVLGILLLFVVTVVFFLLIGFTLAGHAAFPGFFENAASGLYEQVNSYVGSPVLLVVLSLFIFTSLVLIWQRPSLAPRWKQWSLLGLLLALAFVVTFANVSISFIFRFIDTALNQREEPTFWRYLFIYAGLIVTAIPILVLYRYIRLKLGLIWREWLTRHFFRRYFANRAYYELDSNAANTEIDNPDQRITEDVRFFTSVTLSFLLDILNSILDLISFTALLYTISKPLTVGLLIYAFLGTSIAIITGRRLIKLNFNQLRLEADFRYGMVHIRDNAESIAFYRGEQLEIQQVTNRLWRAIRNFDLLIIWQALIDLFQYGYNYFTRIVPYAIIAPLYFAGETDFGTIGQAVFAFSQVLSALSIIANQIQEISRFAAGVNRLGAFDEALDHPTQREEDKRIMTEIDSRVALNNVTLLTPNSEQTLVEHLTVSLQAQEPLLIVGSSGCGKSSLLRAIAGLWTNGEGTVTRPDIDQMLFLPQRPYMLLGTLREQLIYPQPFSSLSDEDLQQVLAQVNLGSLVERMGGLDVVRDWPNVLSLGEQQRLAFARILITRPKYVILDEATSALDVGNEKRLYQTLQSLGVTYISVGHRPSLLAYHQQVLRLTEGTDWQLLSTDQYIDTGEFAAAG